MAKIKRFLCIIAVLVFTGLSVAGCALFERDVAYYNNTVVATVGKDVKITKKQLIDGFNSFGYQYVQSYGMSTKEAMNQTLEILINRSIMLELGIDYFYSASSGNAYGISAGGLNSLRKESARKEVSDFYYQILSFNKSGTAANEQAQARNAAFKALDGYIKNYEKTIRTERGVEDTAAEEETASEETSSSEVYTPYKKFLSQQVVKKAVLGSDGSIGFVDTVQYKMDLTSYAEVKDYTEITESDAPWNWSATPRGDGAAETSITSKAEERLGLALTNNEKGLKYSDKSAEAAIHREYLRLREEEAKNIIINKFKSCYEQGLQKPLDRDSYEYADGISYYADGDHSTSLMEMYGSDEKAYDFAVSQLNSAYVQGLVTSAEEIYKREVSIAIDRWTRGLDTAETIETSILDSLSSLYYIPKSMIDHYFSVSHILVSYSDAQKAEIEQLEADYKSKAINQTDYVNGLKRVREQTRTKVRDLETGEYLVDNKGKEIEKDVYEVLQDVRDRVAPTRYDAAGDIDALANEPVWMESRNAAGKLINESIESQRVSFRDCIYMYNSDPGVFSSDTEYVIGVNESRMVEEFTEASRNLYEKSDAGKRVLGSMSGLVWTEYGAHIIMYTRNLSDFIYSNTNDMLESTYSQFLHATMSSYNNKTWFDKIVDDMTKREYETYESGLISKFKKDPKHKIIIYKSKYKDLV